MSSEQKAIADRLNAIADWRREREFQDMIGLRPEAAARSRRSAAGLDDLAEWIRQLGDEDARIVRLRKLAFRGEGFDPGATLLNELGRFRFHDPEVELDAFLDRMVEFAEQDAHEMGEYGGPQVVGDNPWRANWVVNVDPDEEDWNA